MRMCLELASTHVPADVGCAGHPSSVTNAGQSLQPWQPRPRDGLALWQYCDCTPSSGYEYPCRLGVFNSQMIKPDVSHDLSRGWGRFAVVCRSVSIRYKLRNGLLLTVRRFFMLKHTTSHRLQEKVLDSPRDVINIVEKEDVHGDLSHARVEAAAMAVHLAYKVL